MHCRSCADLIEESLIDAPGVVRGAVDLDSGVARIEFDPHTSSVVDRCAVEVGAGYSASVREEPGPEH
jgi:copper chaperone CopZ